MKKNILANFIGRFWGVLSNFLFLPLYINLLGLESYSLISFSLVINGMMMMMDAGLTATLSREFASSNNSENEKIRIFRTLESCYFIVSIVVIGFLLLASDLIAYKWLNLKSITPETVAFYLKILSFDVGFRLLSHFYSGGLVGLEKQVKSNMYLVFYGVFRNGLVLIPLVYYPSLQLFFVWQSFITFLYVVILRYDLGVTINKSISFFFFKPKIEFQILKKIWKFAGGMLLISIVAGFNSQMDKVALSKLLPIEVLGLYTIAFALSRGLNIVSSPVSIAILPRMTSLFTAGRRDEAVKIFNIGYLLVAILVFSFAAPMSLFSRELIFIWTNDLKIAELACVYVPWIAAGTSFLALGSLPFNVAIANGNTKYNNILGLSSLFITLPGYWGFTKLFGGIGAAITFSFVQVIIVIVFLYIVNNKYLHLNISTIYFKNFLYPIIISVLTSFTLQFLFVNEESRILLLLKIGIVVLCSLFFNALLLVPFSILKNQIRNFKNLL